MKPNKRKRTVAAILSLIMISTLFQPNIVAQVSDNSVNQDTKDEVIDYSGRENSFVQYLEIIKNNQYANEPIILPESEAQISVENSKRVKDDKGKQGVQLSSGGWIEWKFESEENAVYILSLEYKAGHVKGNKPLIDITYDGETPYNELSGYALSRVYKDKTEIKKDSRGNDLIPEQIEDARWQETELGDTSGLSGEALCLYIKKGEHSLRIECKQEILLVGGITLAVKKVVPDIEQAAAYYKRLAYIEVPSFLEKYQAEKAFEKSDVTLYPIYDRNSPATEPYSPTRISRNTIGRQNWSENGMWLSYEVDNIPKDGLYYLTVKYRQSDAVDVTVFRNIYINGEIPSVAYENVNFSYGISWNIKTISDEKVKPVPFYLNKGRNLIKYEVSTGKYTEVLQVVDEANYQLNRLYTQMVMITGTNPDKYRDYYLDKEIPGLLDSFKTQANNLHEAADLFDKLSGEKSSESESIRAMARRLDSFIKDPNSIPLRISSYRDGISSLSGWLNNMTEQPLEMDYFMIHSADSKLPSPKAGLFAVLKHFIDTFLASFFEDYNTVGNKTVKGGSIDVWANVGRDHIQVIKNLITDDFTPKTDVDVNLSVVQTGFIEASLAGKGPDVAIGIARGQPVNLASRSALLDFEGYSEFEDMKPRFADTAMLPYQLNGKIYGIPLTQTFYMMFYRKDILAQLNIKLPETWDDIFEAVPKLQRSHMIIGLPYSVISAATAVDNGLGAKDLYATLLLQNGGSFYKDDYTATALDSEAAVNAFKSWCDFYTKYGFDLAYDFYTRFKSGEMPIGIASYEMFNTISLGAEEIRGVWGMAQVPGTRMKDGSINRSEAGAGTAVVIFKKADNPESCYKFVDWWTSNDIQYNYGSTLENILGPVGRYTTANLDAFSRLPWSDSELELLSKQRESVFELPEIPGSYYVSRSIDNAFRAVIFDGDNPREIFEKENRNINREITRKRRELGLLK
ncbi:MAG: extracellular solute-binding protein [Oscillospiraceae bacterium]|nr:extracellular solute-binding protein [Oscillospiraceae bacterium]MDD4545680.1 extracellular solute-binding protein [Oscillospiraceae bacterium]